MLNHTILAAGVVITAIVVFWFLCALALILIVLIQRGRGGGLSGAFGGLAGGVLGSKTGDFLTWVTVGLAVVFLGFSVLIAKFYKPTITEVEQQVPATQSQLVDVPQQGQFPGPVGGEGTGTGSQNP